MAAGQAAQQGAEVLVLEKMNTVGRKIFISGKGRCNITNVASVREFLDHFGPTGKFLRQAFHRYFSDDVLALLHAHGIETITERGGRVFPVSGQASDVVEALVEWATGNGAKIWTDSPVNSIWVENDHVTGVETPHTVLDADAVIIATGGASYPGTGSTGDGYRLACECGHRIVPIRPALVPLVTAGDTAKKLQGLSLKNISVGVWVDGKKSTDAFGEMLFTHFGVSGPIILTLSRDIVDALQAGSEVILSIDLKPALDHQKLDLRLLRDIQAHGKQQFQTLLKELLPRTMIPVCIEQNGIAAEKLVNQISADERKCVRNWLKDFRMAVIDHRSFMQAIVTAGGVDTREVNPKTMQSRLIAGLYFAGEVLDVDADTGGYNLQAAFSTGWLAGTSAASPAVGRSPSIPI